IFQDAWSSLHSLYRVPTRENADPLIQTKNFGYVFIRRAAISSPKNFRGIKTAEVGLRSGPALSVSRFASYKPTTTVGVSLIITAPTGTYDLRVLNLGADRWSFKPEIGLVTSFETNGLQKVNA